jgi:hypothetical protein
MDERLLGELWERGRKAADHAAVMAVPVVEDILAAGEGESMDGTEDADRRAATRAAMSLSAGCRTRR